jgi:HupE / UreJ protein
MRVFFAILAMGCVVQCDPAEAHTRSQSFSSWAVDEQSLAFVFAVDARRVTQLSQIYTDEKDLQSLLVSHLRETIRVAQGKASCTRVELEPLGHGKNTLRVSGRFVCPFAIADKNAAVTIVAFQVVSATHIHIARVERDGEFADTVLREGRSTFTLRHENAPRSLWAFIGVGFFHVLSGLDHLVFLAALLIVATTPRTALLCITGFTLGHTLSLALATLGIIAPNAQLVEAMIGFTIAVTALEAGARYGLDRRSALTLFAVLTFIVVALPVGGGMSPLGTGVLLTAFAFFTARLSGETATALLPFVTAAFGLVHGAGFAGGLLAFNFLRTELFAPLLGFNIGVELAQLTALVGFYGLMLGLRQIHSIPTGFIERYASISIFTLGCFWFAERIWL